PHHTHHSPTAAAHRTVRRSRGALDFERRHQPRALQRSLEPHRPTRCFCARRLRRGWPSTRRPTRRPPRRRDHLALARRPTRGRAPLGSAAAPSVFVSAAAESGPSKARSDAESSHANMAPATAGESHSQAEVLGLAIVLARHARALLLERFQGGHERVLASKSSPTDLVSEADLASERLIRERLLQVRPADAFLGEEGGGKTGSSGLTWVIDPLDGTVNFLFSIPQWCVSVAVQDDAGVLAGAIFDPCRDELFGATRDGAPTLNGAPIAASERADLASA